MKQTRLLKWDHVRTDIIATPAGFQRPSTSTCLYSSHGNFHLANTCRVGFSVFLSEAGSKVWREGIALNQDRTRREISTRQFLPSRKPLEKKKRWLTSDKWRLCQGEGTSSPALTGRWKPMKYLPWSTSNCTWTRKLELTNRKQVAEPDDARSLAECRILIF